MPESFAFDFLLAPSAATIPALSCNLHSGLNFVYACCGNLRPNHQPFRSVIIDEQNGLVDLESLSLIEDAVHVYESSKLIYPNEIDELTRKDYAFIDFELMKASLIQYNLLRRDLF